MATVFSDDFNRADSTSLGANWTEAAGDFSISSNKLLSTGTSNAYDNNSVGSADYKVSIDMNYAPNAWWTEPYVRDTGATKFTDCYFLYAQHYTSPEKIEHYLIKRVGSSQTTLNGPVATTSLSYKDYTHTITIQGTTIKSYLDGVEKCSATDSSHSTEGNHGLRNVSGSSVDNYLLESFAAATSVKDVIGSGIIAFPR